MRGVQIITFHAFRRVSAEISKLEPEKRVVIQELTCYEASKVYRSRRLS